MAHSLDSLRRRIADVERRIEDLGHDCDERRELRRELKALVDELGSQEAQLRVKGWRT